jgi:elongation factor 1-gamma
MYEAAAIDGWMEFAANELELPACVWWYPVAGYMPFNDKAYEKAKTDLAAVLGKLECHLHTRTYLGGEQITLADIAVASALVYPMKLVCDKTWLKPFTNVTRWFTTCVNQPQFTAVIGQVQMCKKETAAPGQEKKAEPKKAAKKDKPAAAPAPAPAKKPDHPYKIMDKESPSAFNLDAWKKAYSNMSYDDSMNYFWDNFDMDGWALWHMNYKYNHENKKAFMAANAVGGFQQRSDEVRKWAFGVMDVIGTEDTVLEIKGVWLLRGDTVEHLINANDDANWYDWTKIAGPGLAPTDEVKAQVKAYWTAETELEGKPIQDGKVFK